MKKESEQERVDRLNRHLIAFHKEWENKKKNILQQQKLAAEIFEKFRPSGYTFLTNFDYGIQMIGKHEIDTTIDFVNFINWLKDRYLIQIGEALDMDGDAFSKPFYMALAIYIKRIDGLRISKDEKEDVINYYQMNMLKGNTS